jgi:2-polyprenyl-6-hydroxyphenyl methylase / 3-demethylubiquinone-9 3-methyltransferase
MPTAVNLNTTEIAHFDSLASRWWDPEGELQLLHTMNPLRLDYILQQTGGVFEQRLLDVGCGGGILAESLAYEGAEVTGLDMSTELLQIARQHAASQALTIDYQHLTVEAHAETHANYYDVITCMELLEHVPDPAAVVYACSRLVKPQGYVFFSTINRTMKAWLLAIIAAESLCRKVPQGTHRIEQLIRPSELCDWLQVTPLIERHIIGLKYQPLRQCFRFNRRVDINYILTTQHY